jgi:hypothetical protein
MILPPHHLAAQRLGPNGPSCSLPFIYMGLYTLHSLPQWTPSNSLCILLRTITSKKNRQYIISTKWLNVTETKKQQTMCFCFSLGLSWVAGRFSPSQHASAAMLDYLRASIMGLGNSQCEVVYPRCSLQEVVKTRSDRRMRRRRKRHGDTGHL